MDVAAVEERGSVSAAEEETRRTADPLRYGMLADELRDHVRSQRIDPSREQKLVVQAAEELLREDEAMVFRGLRTPLADPRAALRHMLDEVLGFGPLQQLLDDPLIEEIWINSPSDIFVARSGVSEKLPLVLEEKSIHTLVERMLASTGRRLDLSSPFVDASLPDGSRLHVAIPDITRRHWAVNIRKFVSRARSLQHMVALGSLTPQAARFLDAAVKSGLNILVSGATQAGKTTALNCLMSSLPEGQRIITCEEVFELDIDGQDVVGLQCRQPSLEGGGEIPLRRLVKEALRMRPDRIVVGEVREAEALDMLIALNSGLPGAASIHANSARDALTKICTLPLLAGENVSAGFVNATVAQSIDLVVHCTRDLRGRRRVAEILSIGERIEGGVIETQPVFSSGFGEGVGDGVLRPHASARPSLRKFEVAGFRLPDLLQERP